MAVRRFLADRSGASLPVTVLFLTVFLGFGALAVDVTRALAARDQLQAAADAGALAGASVVWDVASAHALAVEFGNKNAPAGVGDVIDPADVLLGTWDSATRTFTAGGPNPNAVQVTAEMSTANGTALQGTLSAALGFTSFDVGATAVATGDNGQQWDVTIVQDVTGSFSQELDDAKTADQTLLQCISERASPDSLVGGVMFTGYGFDMGPMDTIENGFTTLYDSFGNLGSCGQSGSPPCSGTHIGAGITTALDLFDAAPGPNPNTSQAMVIVSDGAPYCKAPACTTSTQDLRDQAVAAADAAEAAGISVFTVLYNENSDPDATSFLQGLVRGDGTFHETPDPTLLTDLLEQVCNATLPLRLVN